MLQKQYVRSVIAAVILSALLSAPAFAHITEDPLHNDIEDGVTTTEEIADSTTTEITITDNGFVAEWLSEARKTIMGKVTAWCIDVLKELRERAKLVVGDIALKIKVRLGSE